MKYYYLDRKREPQGPCSAAELTNLLADGTITPQTEIASPGAADWQVLEIVLPDVVARVLSSTDFTDEAEEHCPDCRALLDREHGKLPLYCPECGLPLRSRKETLWSRFSLGMKLYGHMNGRSTRAEFWSFYFMWMILLIPIAIIIGIASGLANGMLGLHYSILLALGVGFIIFYYIPVVTITVRRLHDAGLSGWWLGAAFLFFFINMGVTGGICWLAYQNGEQEVLNTLTKLEAASPWETPAGLPGPSWLITAYTVSNIANSAMGILLLIFCLLDSKRGENTWGPSAKYPR